MVGIYLRLAWDQWHSWPENHSFHRNRADQRTRQSPWHIRTASHSGHILTLRSCPCYPWAIVGTVDIDRQQKLVHILEVWSTIKWWEQVIILDLKLGLPFAANPTWVRKGSPWTSTAPSYPRGHSGSLRPQPCPPSASSSRPSKPPRTPQRPGPIYEYQHWK